MVDIGRARVLVEFDRDSLDRGIDSAGANIAGKFGKVGIVAGAALVAGVAGAGAALYGIGSIFDDVSDTIRIGTGAQGEALAGLEQSAKNVGTTIPASFEQIGTTIADVNTRLGLAGPTLETLSSQIIEAGRLFGTEIDVNALTSAFGAFGVTGDETTAVMDKLFQISQATGVGLNELTTSVGKGAPALKGFGFGIEESALLLGTLDKAGIGGDKTLAALNRGLVEFAEAGKDPQEALAGTVASIEEFVASGNDAAAINLASTVFGTRGATQFVEAVKSGAVNLDALTGSAVLSGDTILGVAEDTNDFAESWQLFKNNALVSLEPVATRVFGILSDGMAYLSLVGPPALASMGDTINNRVIPALSTMAAWVGENVVPAVKEIAGVFTAEVIPALSTFAGWLDANLVPAVKLIGELFVTDVVPALKDFGGYITGTLVPNVQAFATTLNENRGTVAAVAGVITGVLMPVLVSMGVAHTVAAVKAVAAWVTTSAASVTGAATQVASHYRIVGGWVASGAAAVASGAQTAAIWLMYQAEAVKGAAATVAAHARIAAAWLASKVQAAASAAATGAAWALSSARIVGALALQGAAFVASRVAMVAGAAATGVVTAAQWLLNAALTANPIGIVVVAIAALVGALIYAYQNSETFRNIVNAAWTMVKDTVLGTIEWFKTAVPAAWDWVKNAVTTAGSAISNTVKNAWSAVRTAIGTAVDWVKTKASQGFQLIKTAVINTNPVLLIIKYWDEIKAAISKAATFVKDKATQGFQLIKTAVINTNPVALIINNWDKIKSAISTAATYVKDKVRDGFNAAKDAAVTAIGNLVSTAKEIPGRVMSALGNLASQFKSVGSDIISGIASGIRNGVGQITGAATDAARSALNAAKDFLGISSPSRVMRDQVGAMISEGVGVGIEANASAITGAFESSLGGLHDVTLPTVGVESSMVAPRVNAGAFTSVDLAGASRSAGYGDTHIHVSADSAVLRSYGADIARQVARETDVLAAASLGAL